MGRHTIIYNGDFSLSTWYRKKMGKVYFIVVFLLTQSNAYIDNENLHISSGLDGVYITNSENTSAEYGIGDWLINIDG